MTGTAGQQLLNALAEIEQLRMQLADHGEIITRLETENGRLRLMCADAIKHLEEAEIEIGRLRAEQLVLQDAPPSTVARALEPKP